MNPAAAQHTPGPWYLNPRGWVVQSTGDIVTRIECSNNKEADARLIAAAPDLLAALYLIATDPSAIYSGTNAHIGDIARSAIAKATGGAA